MIAVLKGFGKMATPADAPGGAYDDGVEYIPPGRSSSGSSRPLPAPAESSSSLEPAAAAAAANHQRSSGGKVNAAQPNTLLKYGLITGGILVAAYIGWEIFKSAK